jgi:DNA invertase Pin-like site-specific DNA recombinase
MRIAIYARVSTVDKGQDSENQLTQLRQFAEFQTWELVQEYVDEMSGKSPDRPAFRCLFDAASRREFDLILSGRWTDFRGKACSRLFSTFKG